MVFPGREQFRATLLRYVEVPGAKVLSAAGLSPDAVTLLGFCVSAAAGAVVGSGYLMAGGVVFLAGGALDLMDGALARFTGKTSRFGALLDSLMDRLGEAALFLGMAIYALRADLSDGRLTFFMIALILALVSSQTVSYLRARGEGLGIFTRTGLMTRPERVVVLALGLILGLRPLEVILVVIAVVSTFTLLQRLYTIRKALQLEDGQARKVDDPPDPL